MSPPLVRAVLRSSSRDILPMGDGELCGNERDMRFALIGHTRQLSGQ
jgi:hypothetical protein